MKEYNEPCYTRVKNCGKKCKQVGCKFYIDNKQYLNCTNIASDVGSMTLQEIGDIFGITRMRICQIQKRAIQKLLDSSSIQDCNI